jgi:hypothetical protein
MVLAAGIAGLEEGQMNRCEAVHLEAGIDGVEACVASGKKPCCDEDDHRERDLTGEYGALEGSFSRGLGAPHQTRGEIR